MNGLLNYFKGNARNLWGELKSAPQELKDLFQASIITKFKKQ